MDSQKSRSKFQRPASLLNSDSESKSRYDIPEVSVLGPPPGVSVHWEDLQTKETTESEPSKPSNLSVEPEVKKLPTPNSPPAQISLPAPKPKTSGQRTRRTSHTAVPAPRKPSPQVARAVPPTPIILPPQSSPPATIQHPPPDLVFPSLPQSSTQSSSVGRSKYKSFAKSPPSTEVDEPFPSPPAKEQKSLKFASGSNKGEHSDTQSQTDPYFYPISVPPQYFIPPPLPFQPTPMTLPQPNNMSFPYASAQMHPAMFSIPGAPANFQIPHHQLTPVNHTGLGIPPPQKQYLDASIQRMANPTSLSDPFHSTPNILSTNQKVTNVQNAQNQPYPSHFVEPPPARPPEFLRHTNPGQQIISYSHPQPPPLYSQGSPQPRQRYPIQPPVQYQWRLNMQGAPYYFAAPPVPPHPYVSQQLRVIQMPSSTADPYIIGPTVGTYAHAQRGER